MNIAEQLEQNEKYDEAYAEYKKLLAQKPSDVEILSKLAHLALILDKKEEAKAYYAMILEVDPANIMAHEQLIDIFADEDRFKYYLIRGNMHALQQQMSQAKQILEEQLPLDEQFHSQLLRCTHNRFLIGMIPLLVEFFAKILPEFSRLRQTSYEASFEEHAKIIEALRIHDGVRLERLLRAHLDVYLELK